VADHDVSTSDPAAGCADHARIEPADPVRLLFDAKAARWPQNYAPNGRLVDRLTRLAAIVDHHVATGECVLDLGCGTGELARHMAAAGLRVTACDISTEMLSRAATSDPGGAVNWVQLDPGWRVLPFDSAAFHIVVAASVLEYVDDPARVLSECARVVRPGSMVLCTVPDPRHPIRWLEWLACPAARLQLARAASRHWPRLDDYLTYLRISRQRYPAHRWRAIAEEVGLWPAYPLDAGSWSPLRLQVFRRPDETGQLPGRPRPEE
jgi:2-polyprenyl-3-methyl-5-hydroxy-6-metoxy-1,4-benzoquinol methylase